MDELEKLRELHSQARAEIQTWLDKQGHDRCWYYPEIFRKLAEIFEVKMTVDPKRPSIEEFRGGCRRYQQEEFNLPVAEAEDESWKLAYCPQCGAQHEIVRPGKTQPSCDCDNICQCGGRITFHLNPDPRWPNFSGYFCDDCGPFGGLEDDA